jgi:intergrase/recombinase
MLRLGISETYIDAFCGRVSKSISARHYSDFSPIITSYKKSMKKLA